MTATWSALIVDDDPGVRQSLRLCLEADGARILGVGTPAGALEALERGAFDVVFLDLWLGSESGLALLPEVRARHPRAGVVVITAFASYESAVEAMRQGAVDYLPKPFTPEQVRHAARRVRDAQQLQRQVAELQDRVGEVEGEALFETHSARQAQLLQTAQRAAASDCVVLLTGESGTGKNVFARWLRAHSPRADGPFVTVHCPMLVGDLMSSALFGHRKGAFTGAVRDEVGKVQEAEGGTLFLDEVGDLDAQAQARLLRFLNDRTYERVGEAQERRADVRIVAATNRSLEAEVRAGRFREDLLFRLNVVTLCLPPLRERAEDVLPLARHYLAFFARRAGRDPASFSPRAERALVAHGWPGNLRELRNAVERALILAPGATLEPEDLGLPGAPQPGRAAVALGDDVPLEAVEREHIARIVARAPTLEAAARVLQIDATTLQRKRKRYGLA
ncbi:MAG: sigma-54-dependent Fis family transcriptional regulator [Planctomycetes bacterium]|nr:sigma-54-dependent Fis family transcriptional regulator [Planctomycetota bacterium]